MTLTHSITGTRWINRILAIGIAGFALAIFVAREQVNPSSLSVPETALMVAFLMAATGLLIAWRSELADGVFTVGGILFLAALHWMFSGGLPRGWDIEVIAVLASLFVICEMNDKSHDTTLPRGRISVNG